MNSSYFFKFIMAMILFGDFNKPINDENKLEMQNKLQKLDKELPDDKKQYWMGRIYRCRTKSGALNTLNKLLASNNKEAGNDQNRR